MKPRFYVKSVGTSLIFLFLLGCSILKTPAPGNPQPNLNTPSSSQMNYKWEVSITGAHEEKQLRDSGGTTYTPNSGFTFLIVDVILRNIDASSETRIADTEIKVIDNVGNEFENAGSGFGLTYSLGGSSTYSNDQDNKITLSLVFSVKNENIDKGYIFQVLDAAPVSFDLTK